MLTVVLLPLEFVNGGDFSRHVDEWVMTTIFGDFLFDEIFLSTVRCENCNLLFGVPHEPHINVQSDNVFCLL